MNKSTVVKNQKETENQTEAQNYINLNYASAVNLKQLPLSGNYFDRLLQKPVCL